MIASADRLEAVARTIVSAGGSAEREAALVAHQLVAANLTGHDSHGVGMLPRYVDALVAGDLLPNQKPTVVHDAGMFLTLDGNRGYGQVMGHEAMALGIARARAHGTAIVGLTNTHHLGRIGHWAEQCVGAGLVSIHFVNVISRPIVAPWGGRDARLGTNPLCIGVPRAGAEPILLDFATSRLAQGKVRVAFNKGERLPEGALLDVGGEPTVDPRAGVLEPYGALLPFAEHKGYALAFLCELLGGALAGGPTLHVRDRRRGILNGMLTIILDPERLGTSANLQTEMTAFIDFVRESPRRPGVDRILIPGEPERETRAARSAHGIPVDGNTWAEILAAGAKLGVPERALDGGAAGRPSAAPPPRS